MTSSNPPSHPLYAIMNQWPGRILGALAMCLFTMASSRIGAEALIPDSAKAERIRSSLECDGKVIDSIEIVPRNIYNTSDPHYDKWVFRFANKVHYVTRTKIIRRELLFGVGDKYSTELAEEMARNLRTRYALNNATVEPVVLPDGRLITRVTTVDKWSLVGGMRFNREGNRTNYQFGFEERNLLGYHQFLSFDYYIQEKEGNYIDTKFSDRRLWGYPLTLDLEYKNNPLDKVSSSQIIHPYYNLRQHWSYYIAHSRTGGRRDLYGDSIRAASTQVQGDNVALGGQYRWGPYRTKFTLGADYRYLYTVSYDRRIYDSTAFVAHAIVFPEDSLYHRLGASAEFANYEFVTAERVNGMKYTEDFTLGFTASIRFGRAFTPRFNDFVFDDVGGGVSYGTQFGSSIMMVDYSRSFLFRDNNILLRNNAVTLRYYNTSLRFMTVAARSAYVSLTRADGANTLILGGDDGIRGYDKYYRTGDRYHVVNMELRFFPNLELLSVIVGGAMFADLARTWKQGEVLAFKNYHASIGAGLRVSLEKLSKGELIRVDLAHGQDNTWQLSAGSHQYF